MRFNTLPEWLAWQETLHFTAVDPGLERIAQVWQQLGQSTRLPFTVITVAGTNGKGSSVAMLDAILHSANYRVGSYTSPHLFNYNERIKVEGESCSDQQLCSVFEQIDQARGSISLTYFEFSTLAAALIFSDQQVDIAILEVGMGGRLDAVNLFDNDIALITPISLDHTQWLGDDKESIAFEKAGVIRMGNPVVCSEARPAKSLINYANELDAELMIAGKTFDYQLGEQSWSWSNDQQTLSELSLPALKGQYQLQNAAAVLQCVDCLNTLYDYKINQTHIETGLSNVSLLGRFQVIPGDITVIFDVTHNQQGAENLASLLAEQTCDGKTYAVLGMLQDKQAAEVGLLLQDQIDHWYLGGLGSERGQSSNSLSVALSGVIAVDNMTLSETVVDSYQSAMQAAISGDRLLVFGSFLTVEAVMRLTKA